MFILSGCFDSQLLILFHRGSTSARIKLRLTGSNLGIARFPFLGSLGFMLDPVLQWTYVTDLFAFFSYTYL